MACSCILSQSSCWLRWELTRKPQVACQDRHREVNPFVQEPVEKIFKIFFVPQCTSFYCILENASQKICKWSTFCFNSALLSNDMLCWKWVMQCHSGWRRICQHLFLHVRTSIGVKKVTSWKYVGFSFWIFHHYRLMWLTSFVRVL